MQYSYLLVDFFTLIIPFLFSFHKKIQFHKTWFALFPAITITGIIFIAWDVYFTKIGIWGFNPRYLLGYTLFSLPLEEVLFFICIPYSCIFTYHCFKTLISSKFLQNKETLITYALVATSLILASMHNDKWYTSVTFALLSFLLIYCKWVAKVKWLSDFYLSYFILLIPFSIVNGVLTGTGLDEPIVWYNNNENMHVRIGTIPVEDIFYGMLLILANVFLWERLQKTANSKWD